MNFFRYRVNVIGQLCRINVPRRGFGGYIEDAQLALLGFEIYRDVHGPTATISRNFVVPATDEWPSNLWHYELGKSVEKHIGNEQNIIDDREVKDPRCTAPFNFFTRTNLGKK